MDLLTIGDVATRSGTTTSALRFYEQEGLISSQRTDGGQRRFRRDAIRRVAFILTAQRLGLSLGAIRTALDTLPAARTPTKDDWSRLARSWKPMLDERIAALERLRDQLDGCIGCGCLSLGECALSNPEDTASSKGSGPRYLLGDPSAS